MYAIIGAMDKEIFLLKSLMQVNHIIEDNKVVYYEGTFHNHPLVLVQCGIGKVMAAIVTTRLIERFHPKVIINIGTAGGVNKGLKPLDIVIGAAVAYHDVDVRGFSSNYRYGQVPGGFPLYFQSDSFLVDRFSQLINSMKNSVHVGTILSGDLFMTDRLTLDQRVNDFFGDTKVDAVDMESAAIAQVCHLYQIPWVVIRSISDVVGQVNQQATFEEYVERSSARITQLLGNFFAQL